MTEYKKLIIRHIGQKARRRLADLSREFARAKSEDKEEILASMEFEGWLADSCSECLNE